MKSSIFLVFSILFCRCALNAQMNQIKRVTDVTFGIKAGTNISNVYDTNGENFVATGKFGFVGGGFVTVPFGEYFAVQPELLFSQKGFSGIGTLLGSNYNYEKTINFLDIPILFTFSPIKYISVVFGPQFSFLMSYKNSFNNTFISSLQIQQFNNENIRKNIFGLTTGADFNSTYNTVIGVRASWDLQQNNTVETATPRYKNVWYQITAGYRF